MSVETGRYISDKTKQHLRRSAWRARHANRPVNNNIEIIDLTQNVEETPTPEKIDQIKFQPDGTPNPEIVESSQTIYTTTITKFFTKIEQYLLTVRHSRENQIDN